MSGVEYLDGAEDHVLAILTAARDVSAGSDELAALVSSWELAYHLGPQRQALLAPLRLRPGMRAVDVGCGSGVLTRALADAGLDVLGIEPVPSRAAAARERCRDAPSARIVAAAVQDGLTGEEPFDLAVVCGVLEHSGWRPEQHGGFLQAVAGSLAPGGVLVLAIENQIGLGYLAGRAEDHHDRSWIGLADYPYPGPRTWTKARLGRLLADAGLTHRRWLFPYPDYKLPRVILDEDAFGRPDAREFVDRLVRDPLLGAFGGDMPPAAARVLHRMAVEEGFAATVAPSFLVVASASAGAVQDVLDGAVGWLVGGARRRQWRRTRRITSDLVETVTGAGERSESWLRQVTVDKEPLVGGEAMDRLLLDALRAGDESELRRLLVQWRLACFAGSRALKPADARHPFLPGRAGVPVLPADCLDIHPGNVVVTDGGETVRVDREWHAGDGVDAELAALRALVEFGREVLTTRAAQPWGELTLRELAGRLCELAGLPVAVAQRWPEYVAAEGALQELVGGAPMERVVTALTAEGDRRAERPLWTVPEGLAGLRTAYEERDRAVQERDRAIELAGSLAAELADARDHAARQAESFAAEQQWLNWQLRAARSELDRLQRRTALAMTELADACQQATHWQQAAADATQRLDMFERSRLARFGPTARWPLARLVRGTRDLVLGKGGADADGVLRRMARSSPTLARLAGSRIRRTSVQARQDGLSLNAEITDPAVPVGRGQLIPVAARVAHRDLPIRRVWVVVDGHRHRARLRRDGGHHVRADAMIPFGAAAAGRLVQVRLAAELGDGTVADQRLTTLRLVEREQVRPVEHGWSGDGPRVAICLASYRPQRRQLAAQLASIRAQTHANWMCVISDDASTPQHRAMLRELTAGDDRFVVVQHETNVGFYRNFERALTLAPDDADAIALCDQDDVWDADKLSTLLAELADPAVQLAYSDLRLIDDHDEVVADSFWARRRNQCHDLESLLLLNTVTGAASLVRAELVRQRALPFPPATESAFHDHWLALTALSCGRIAFVDKALQSYRQHGGNVTGHRQQDLDENLPSLPRLVAAVTGVHRLPDDKQSWLTWAAEHDLRRVATFARVLLLRNADVLGNEQRCVLARLAEVDAGLRPLVALARRGRGRRQVTAGAERYLLGAALGGRAGARTRSAG